MEIALSKKTVTRAVIILAILTALGVGAWAWANGSFSPRPETDYNSQPAMQALADMYSPDHNGERAAWEDKVCANMTEEGCKVFKKLYSQSIWDATLPEGAYSASFAEVAEVASDGTEVWAVNVVKGGTTKTVYLHAQKTEAGTWLLIRVLFDQEAKKYEK
jgi:hypothetical protein